MLCRALSIRGIILGGLGLMWGRVWRAMWGRAVRGRAVWGRAVLHRAWVLGRLFLPLGSGGLCACIILR